MEADTATIDNGQVLNKDLMDSIAVEAEILRVAEKRQVLIDAKKLHEGRLSDIAALVSGRWLPRDQYADLVQEQATLKRRIRECDAAIAKLKAEIRLWQHMAQECKLRGQAVAELSRAKNAPEQSKVTDEIRTLRAKYLDFAEDQTRVNSMRVMAAQFANELTSVLASSTEG